MRNKRYNLYFIALFYAIFITLIFPWTTIYNGDFADIPNYIYRIEYLHSGGKEAVHTGISILFNEPIWRYVILGIGNFFDDYRLALYLVSMLTVFLYSIFLFKRVDCYIGMIFMFNPMFSDLFMSQVRSAFAFSLLLLAYDMRSKILKIVLAIVSFLIHSAMPVFILIYFLLSQLNQRVASKKFYLITIIVALIVALFMKYGIDTILTYVGDRRVGYDAVIKSASISYSIVWFIIGLIIATFATFENDNERIIAGYAITITSFFFFSSVMGNFAQRFMALSIPLVIISIGYLPKHYKQGTYVIFFLYTLLMFKYKLTNIYGSI